MGAPALTGMGTSAVPRCPLNNPPRVFFLYSAEAVNRVEVYEEFAKGFTVRVRGKPSRLGQDTVIMLAKPSSISNWVHSQWLY